MNEKKDVNLNPSNLIDILSKESVKTFSNTKWVGSFEEYLDIFAKNPYNLARTSPQYIHDCFLSFGEGLTWERGDAIKSYKLFEDKFKRGKDRLFGQEKVLRDLLFHLRAAALEEGPNRMYILHGPPGSGKTLIVDLLSKGLEAYSKTVEGRKFKFSWVFDTSWVPGKKTRGNLGFSKKNIDVHLESYAKLPKSQILREVPCLMRESPLLLLPKSWPNSKLTDSRLLRQDFLESHFKNKNPKKPVPKRLLDSDLCFNCNSIFDFLMDVYDGDLKEVYKHIKVSSYNLSERSGQGIASIGHEPGELTITSKNWNWEDPSISIVLPDLELKYLSGKPISANNGLIHVLDPFKTKGIEHIRSLTTICESNCVSAGRELTLDTDITIFLTANEEDLVRPKSNPVNFDFWEKSKKFSVPYLLNAARETQIYKSYIENTANRLHVGPFTAEVLAWWSVLCRLDVPQGGNNRTKEYAGLAPAQKRLINTLSPWQKLNLYSVVGDRDINEVSKYMDDSKELKITYNQILAKYKDNLQSKELSKQEFREAFDLIGFLDFNDLPTTSRGNNNLAFTHEQLSLINSNFMKALRRDNLYEGSEGPSPRIIQDIIANITSKHDVKCLNPLIVFDRLEEIITEKFRLMGKIEFDKDPDLNLDALGFNLKKIKEETKMDDQSEQKIRLEDPHFLFLVRGTFNNLGYYNFHNFIALCKNQYTEKVREHLLESLSTVTPDEIDLRIRNYIDNIFAWSLGDKVYDSDLDTEFDPNSDLMDGVEDRVGIDIFDEKVQAEFRHDLINKISRLSKDKLNTLRIKVDGFDKPQLDYKKLYPQLYSAYNTRTIEISFPLSDLIDAFGRFNRDSFERIEAEPKEYVLRTIKRFTAKQFGDYKYCDDCAKKTILYALNSGIMDEDIIEVKNIDPKES